MKLEKSPSKGRKLNLSGCPDLKLHLNSFLSRNSSLLNIHLSHLMIYHMYESKIMNGSVPRKWLTCNKEKRYLYCSCCISFESPNTCNLSPFVHNFIDYRCICQNLALHKSTTTHVRNAQIYQCG